MHAQGTEGALQWQLNAFQKSQVMRKKYVVQSAAYLLINWADAVTTVVDVNLVDIYSRRLCEFIIPIRFKTEWI